MPFDGLGLGTDSDPVVRTLVTAQAIVRTRGFIQRNLGALGEARCAIGAIQEAAGVDGRSGLWVDGRDKVAWLASECYGRAVGAERVQAWQDDPKRTHEDVVAGFDLAIEWRILNRSQLPVAV